MRTPEHSFSPPDHARHKEEQSVHYSWENFVWQLLSTFPIEFDQGYPTLRVYLPTSDRQLAIDIGDGTVRVTYNRIAQYGVTSLAELTFDSTNEGGWAPVEVEYTSETWRSFTREVDVVQGTDGSGEQYYDFDMFTAYVLRLIQPVLWLNHGQVHLSSTRPANDPDWLYYKHEPVREDHPATW